MPLPAVKVRVSPVWGVVIDTVAPVRFAESVSLTVTPESTTTAAPPSVNGVEPGEVVTVGATSAVVVIVLVAGVLARVPSVTVKVIVLAAGNAAAIEL